MPVTTRTRRLLGVASATALAAAGIALTQGDNAVASSPTSGTITDTSAPVTWTGGPFVVPNTTGAALAAPDCTAPMSCDDFTLHVTTPAGYGTQHKLTIATSWSNAAADFDVYVIDAAGNTVGQSASSADPETVVLPPTTGTYTVRVVPFAPLGESYTAKATMTTQAVPPPPGASTPPGFANYAAPSSLRDSNNAGEPSIGDNWKTGSVMYQAGLSTYRVKFDSASPAAASFKDVSAGAANGCPQGSTISLDPILFTDHATGRTFESQLTGQDSATCLTDDDGATWHPSQGGGIPSGVDHQTLGGGTHSASDPIPNSPVDPANPGGPGYTHSVYYCSQSIAAAFCAASHDGGTTFGAGAPTYSLLDCGGLHGHVKVAPDGTAYLPNKSCGSSSAVAVSKDGGTSWAVNRVPGTTPGDSDPSVGIGSNGTAYFGYVAADGKPGVAVSRDKGTTWTDLQSVGSDFGIQNAVFPTVVAGDDDRATLAYLGTPTGGNYQGATFDGTWHLYLSTTYDGGKTWVTSDATPTDPVQRGSICTGGTTCGNNRNLLDFIDVTTDSHGRIEVGYADGCINACVTDTSHNSNTGPADAQAAYATIARQSSGLTLLSAYDPAPNLTLTKQTVTKDQAGNFVDTLVVANTGLVPVTGFTTRVLDNGRSIGSQVKSLPAGRSATLTFTWKPTGGTHTVTGSVDPDNRIAESNEHDNKLVVSIRK